MARSDTAINQAYERVVEAFAKDYSVRVGGKSNSAFGASALRVNEKIFAMVSSKNTFVLKLPKNRVDDLVAQGIGSRFEPSKGRFMKESIAMTNLLSA